MSARQWTGLGIGAVAALAGAFVAGRLSVSPPAAAPATTDASGPSDARGPAAPVAPERGARPLLAADPRAKPRPETSIVVDLATLPGPGFPDSPNGLVDVAVWPTLVFQHVKAGRLRDAVEVLRVAAGLPSARGGLVHLVVRLQPDEFLALHAAAKAAGLALDLDRPFLEARLTLAGRAEDVVGGDLEALSRADDQTVFVRLVDAALARGAREPALRAQAEREPWPPWKLAATAAALEQRRDGAAAAWRAWADRGLAEAERAAAATEAASLRERIAGAREAVGERPGDATAWEALSRLLLDAGDRAGAIDACERALAINVYDSSAAQRLGALAPERMIKLVAEAWREVRDDDDLASLVDAYLRVGRGREAAETWLRIVEPDFAWGALGLSVFAPEASLRALAPRIARDPSEGELLVARAWAEQALGRPPEVSVREAVQHGFDFDSTTACLLLAPEALVAHFGALGEPMAPGDPQRAAFAVALRRTGQAERVAAVLGPLLAATDDWPNAWYAAWIAAAEPDARGAVLRAKLGSEREPSPSSWRDWAVYCALVDRRGDAIVALDRAIELDPDDTEARIFRLVLAR